MQTFHKQGVTSSNICVSLLKPNVCYLFCHQDTVHLCPLRPTATTGQKARGVIRGRVVTFQFITNRFCPPSFPSQNYTLRCPNSDTLARGLVILQDIFFQAERVVYDAFVSPEFVDRLVSFLSLEENKGRDKYSTNRFSMFKVRRNSASSDGV